MWFKTNAELLDYYNAKFTLDVILIGGGLAIIVAMVTWCFIEPALAAFKDSGVGGFFRKLLGSSQYEFDQALKRERQRKKR